MSNKTIQIPHPLRRQGSTRVARLLKALDPLHFRLDDRSMQDLLVTAHRYAGMLAWFDSKERPDGDWTCFWETETLTYLAVLSAIDLEQLRKTYDDADYALGLLLESQAPGESLQEKDAYRRLAEILLDMARGLESRYRKLIAIRHPLQHLLLQIIRRDNSRDVQQLEGALAKLISLHKAKDDNLTLEQYAMFIHPDRRWGLGEPDDYLSIIVNAPAETPREQLRGLFIQFYDAYMVLKDSAQRAFDQELARMEKPEAEEYRIVQPHISLFIAFLRLFHHAQDSLNALVQKQLDFYYEQVLALRRAPAQPDSVFLIFTLAKNFEPQWVKKGDRLFGGKDKTGRPIFYETTKDWIISQAKVEVVKGFYLPGNIYSFNYDTGVQFGENYKTVLGEERTLPLNRDGVRAFADDATSTEQEVGFVIASPQLLLQEGLRLIEIKITNVSINLTSELVNVQLSLSDDWSKPLTHHASLSNITSIPLPFSTTSTPPTPNPNIPAVPAFALRADTSSPTTKTLTITIFLPKDFPPVEPIAGSPMTRLPAVKITLKEGNLLEIGQDYQNLISKWVVNQSKAFTISVAVEGVSKNLILQTDQGVFRGSQQIMPFGPTAPKGSQFYVGFAEALLKKVDRAQLKLNWVKPFNSNQGLKNYYGGYGGLNPSGSTKVGVLNNNVFSDDNGPSLNFTEQEVVNVSLALSSLSERTLSAITDFQEYDPSIKRGFIRLTFNGNLYHDEYAEKLALRSIRAAGGPDTTATANLQAIQTYIDTSSNSDISGIQSILRALPPAPSTLPNPPYTPTFNAIELDYLSTGQAMEDGVDEFFYLHPFEGFEPGEIPAALAAGQVPQYSFGKVTLFKDFIQKGNNDTQRAHLYLGFSGLKPGASLSMLIQTVEGSEKRADVDPAQIKWSCLSAYNQWEPIAPDKVLMDSTKGLTRSGIVQLSLPGSLSNEGCTILDPALHWLRAVGVERSSGPARLTAALPDIAYIHAQVAEAQFADAGENEYSHLENGLPAGSISKLVISRSAVKKIEQPFASFGGRLPESEGMAFYMRISERLRHRDRAVTVWDYEHLLLEAFPGIAAVKCIPHTQYPLFPASELAPGSVTIAVIPGIDKRSGAPRERPRFSKGDLDDMRDFLLARTTRFLAPRDATGEPTLYVTNAQYETIEVSIRVALRPDFADKDFYKLQLDKDLRGFLSPWLAEGGAAPAFGGRLRRSELIRFVEELPYIDYVEVGSPLIIEKDAVSITSETIRPGAAHGILCSAAKHTVIIL